MSNLNINNIDVQRVINVLQELKRKLQLLSFFTIQTMEKLMTNEDELLNYFEEEKVVKEIKDHFELMKVFRKEHALEAEQEKQIDKQAEVKNDEDQPELVQEEKMEKEKENLLELEENESSRSLAKSARNICRLFYKEDNLLEKIKTLRANPMINKFIDEFIVLIENSIKQVKMTLEEEKSDKTLNSYLTAKIIELENEIKVKRQKLDKLVKERNNFKNDCKNQLEEIDQERENIKNFTDNKLKEKEDEINFFLFRREEKYEENKKNLDKRLAECISEFNAKKLDNETKERQEIEQLTNLENQLKGVISEFDVNLTEAKETFEKKTKENQEKAFENEILRNTRDKLLEKYNTYLEAYRKYEKKRDIEEFKKRQNVLSSEFVQAHFRGFITRKQMKKKFKFLNGPNN